jgi:hypothetical protein
MGANVADSGFACIEKNLGGESPEMGMKKVLQLFG